MEESQIIGVDIGGTNLRAGLVNNGIQISLDSNPLYVEGTRDEVLAQIFGIVDNIMGPDVGAIGVGVPGLVDPVNKIPYGVENIRSINEVDIRTILEKRYNVPVRIENDANCFALGEFYYGSGCNSKMLVGLTIGTGLGTGIIADGKLLIGKNGGTGEFGMINYLERNIEYYVSGRFFMSEYGTTGEEIYRQALHGNPEAIYIYEDFGRHLGEALKLMIYALDPDCIIIGGAVKAGFPFYSKSMWKTLDDFAFGLSSLKIEASSLVNGNILGAAALHLPKVDKNYEGGT